jgi:hypothetical protein
MSEPYANLCCRMISLAVQTVFARGCRRAVRAQPRPEDLRIVLAFLSAQAAAAPAPVLDRLVRPDVVARFKPLSGGVPGTRAYSNPIPTTIR